MKKKVLLRINSTYPWEREFRGAYIYRHSLCIGPEWDLTVLRLQLKIIS
jgi:hypothetical protein